MDWTSLALFCGVYAVAVATPGPGVAAVIARALATGARRSVPFIAGIVLGDLAWFAFAALGLAFVAQTFQLLFTIIKYAGAAYLLVIAWKMWRAAPDAGGLPYVKGEGWRLMGAGLALTLGNPKTMIFFLAILPNLVPLERMTPLAIVEISMTMIAILGPIMVLYALLAERARRLVGSSRSMRNLNRLTGGILAGTAIAVASR